MKATTFDSEAFVVLEKSPSNHFLLWSPKMVLFGREEQSTPPWQLRDCWLVRDARVTDLLSKDRLYRGSLPVPAAWETLDLDSENTVMGFIQ
jgi:hypothetical protein